jgi:hypothetical protein
MVGKQVLSFRAMGQLLTPGNHFIGFNDQWLTLGAFKRYGSQLDSTCKAPPTLLLVMPLVLPLELTLSVGGSGGREDLLATVVLKGCDWIGEKQASAC